MSQELTLVHRPVFFPAGRETVFGLFTPAPAAKGPGVVILSGGLHGTSTVGRNRTFLRLAERLASAGYPVLRFDYHGIGESTGLAGGFGSDAPFATDAVAAARWMEDQGIDQIVLLGKCFGARLAWAAAGDVRGLAGVVAIDSPMHHYGKGERRITEHVRAGTVELVRRTVRPETLRGLLDPKRRRSYQHVAQAKVRALRNRVSGDSSTDGDYSDRVSRSLVSSFERLVERRVPVLFLYGSQDKAYHAFAHAREGPLGRLIERAGSLTDVQTIAGEVEGFAYAELQERVVDTAIAWLDRRFP
jgi:pimeloyl-ACP methyl ester carboxylesterase